jgi:hypothetical protein
MLNVKADYEDTSLPLEERLIREQAHAKISRKSWMYLARIRKAQGGKAKAVRLAVRSAREYNHRAVRIAQRLSLQQEVEWAERRAGWDPNP